MLPQACYIRSAWSIWSSGSRYGRCLLVHRLGIEDAVWNAAPFTKNRGRLLDGEVAAKFLAAVLPQDEVKGRSLLG